MNLSENASVFFSNPVRDYRSSGDWEGVETSYRLRIDGSAGPGQLIDNLNSLVQQQNASQLEALVIGRWDRDDNRTSAEVIQALVQHRHRLNGLLAIFLGDIAQEQFESSKIQNSDVSPLLHAFPNLEVLRVRGGSGLQFSNIRHESLRALIVEAGGLPRSVLREICSCDFPNLVHLDLWLGSSTLGWDGNIVDLQPILDGLRFPRLRYLGLRHSEIANEIAAAIVRTPILEQLRVLNLSSNHLSDAGVLWLMSTPWNVPLRRLILSRHSLSRTIVEKLRRETCCEIITDELSNQDEPGHPVLAT